MAQHATDEALAFADHARGAEILERRPAIDLGTRDMALLDTKFPQCLVATRLWSEGLVDGKKVRPLSFTRIGTHMDFICAFAGIAQSTRHPRLFSDLSHHRVEGLDPFPEVCIVVES